MATIIPQQRQGHSAAEALQMSASPCSLCAARLLELKRQAMKVMMIEYHKSMLKTSAPSVSYAFLGQIAVCLCLKKKNFEASVIFYFGLLRIVAFI